MKDFKKATIQADRNVQLALRYYQAESVDDPARKSTIVLVHGLMNSADVFDVPGYPQGSVARWLTKRGHDVYTYDQRGTGASSINDWTFGLAENAFNDLPAVVRFAMRNSKTDKISLGGYSLGGLIIYLFVTLLFKYESSFHDLKLVNLNKIFTMASPGIFLPRVGRWKHLFDRGGKYLINVEDKIDRSEFLRSQIYIYNPFLSLLLPKFTINAALNLAKLNILSSFIVKNLPIPSFLFQRTDFDTKTFHAIVKSDVIDQTSKKLFTELFHCIDNQGKILVDARHGSIVLPDDFNLWHHIPLLLFSSKKDELVLSDEVKAIYERVPGSIHHIIDEKFAEGCGHSGFVFKKQIAEYVYQAIGEYLNS